MELVRGKIGFNTFCNRLISIFYKRIHRIPEIVELDLRSGVSSVFFFGMNNILGMSYKKHKAIQWIKFVTEKGFDVGVHGVEIDDSKKMQIEFNDFQAISKLSAFGIRTHYVRYNETTFRKMADAGYLFDTSEFSKTEITLKPPYKVEKMWEFPLHIMDGYILNTSSDIAMEMTIHALDKAKKSGIKYFTFLFHDYLFNEKTYPEYKCYYEWFIDYCIEHNFRFISYKEAINELEEI
jgi:hypothetical protein